ncbi:helix-turn-helix domain-containing protein [Ammoniphilus sp. 3BR4]|uniref:helix-turn-helix domain-containing protein n=1 Tax=Ammoniphilus sp. 3BR4 TaxID=3158265 RepID=UPI0034668898
MNYTKETGAKIIKQLGISPYILWRYLIERNIKQPSMKELEEHFGRNERTIRVWLKKLEVHGYMRESA